MTPKVTFAIFLLLTGASANAATVSFAEGYCNVPDWMNEVSAAQNKNLPAEVKQVRAFSGTDPSNGKLVQVFFCKADYSLTLQNLKATAAASEEEIKVQFQKFIGQGFSPGITITMENAATDLPEQRMTAILSCSGRGRVFKELSSVTLAKHFI